MPARNRFQDLFSYWHAVETFTPKPFRVFSLAITYTVSPRNPLPWNSEQLVGQGTGARLRHLVAHCLLRRIRYRSHQQNTRRSVRSRLRADEERPRGDTALLCLRVDDDGTPLTDTVVSSSAAWAVSLARKHGAGVIDRLRDFDEANARLLEAAQVHLAPFEAPDIPDESADNVQDKQATPLLMQTCNAS